VGSPGSATEEAGKAVAQPASEAERFGPNSAEVAVFVEAVSRLTPAQWRKVIVARRHAATVMRDSSGPPAEAVRAMLRGEGEAAPGPAANLAAALGPALAGKDDDEVVAAWQAASALSRRRQLAALTFAANYAPFAAVVPLVAGELAPDVQLYAKLLRWLGPEQWQALARPWTLEREVLTWLMQAAAKSSTREAEEAAALAAIAAAPKHLPGDAGWAAVKTVAHGSRVLASRPELSQEQLTALWVPLEEPVPLRSLDERPVSGKPKRAKAAGPKPVVAVAKPEPRPKKRPAVKRGPLYGANHADVATFIKTVVALTPIQWLRVLDRRQLVAAVTRERSAEPGPVVRACLAAVAGTAELDLEARCRVYAAVERAAFALESRDRLPAEQVREHYGAVGEVVPTSEVDAATFPSRLAALNPEEWVRLAELAPEVNTASKAPLVNAGDALAATLAARSDDEVAVTWQALNALVHRHLLSPIKLAASFAPFASAVTIIKPRSLSPAVQRYLTAVGRLSAHQASILAEPWLVADDVSNALSRAVADGGARAAEEAAALAALVTVPMRLTGDAGWAAAKTAAYGARVAASRGKVTPDEFEALWKPLERAIPAASLDAPPKQR
jgi:hypothetical protein